MGRDLLGGRQVGDHRDVGHVGHHQTSRCQSQQSSDRRGVGLLEGGKRRGQRGVAGQGGPQHVVGTQPEQGQRGLQTDRPFDLAQFGNLVGEQARESQQHVFKRVGRIGRSNRQRLESVLARNRQVLRHDQRKDPRIAGSARHRGADHQISVDQRDLLPETRIGHQGEEKVGPGLAGDQRRKRVLLTRGPQDPALETGRQAVAHRHHVGETNRRSALGEGGAKGQREDENRWDGLHFFLHLFVLSPSG